MTTFFAVAGVFGLVMLLMAVGVMMGRKPISGSCGGLNAIEGGAESCPVCGIGAGDVCGNEGDNIQPAVAKPAPKFNALKL